MVRRREITTEQNDALREVEEVPAAVAYLYEEQIGSIRNKPSIKNRSDDSFIFQYWPEEVSDTYTPNYNEIPIPGGSHPLYQYVGGQERQISFTATFTSEISDLDEANTDVLITKLGPTGSRYTVDVKAAVARLQQYLYPSYGTRGLSGVVEAPPRLVLVMTGMNLGRDQDQVLVILRGASVTYTHWFNDGTPRVASVALEFSESVQLRQRTGGPQVKFIGSDRYQQFSKSYRLHDPWTTKPRVATRHGA